jgi:hypothetical protein
MRAVEFVRGVVFGDYLMLLQLDTWSRYRTHGAEHRPRTERQSLPRELPLLLDEDPPRRALMQFDRLKGTWPATMRSRPVRSCVMTSASMPSWCHLYGTTPPPQSSYHGGHLRIRIRSTIGFRPARPSDCLTDPNEAKGQSDMDRRGRAAV